jgi:X-Pro dipeptidyl-peptidase
MWLAQTGHVDPFDFRRKKFVNTLHRWYDYWLHDINNGIMKEPQVDIERGVGNWKTYGTWPAAKARSVRLFLREKKGRKPGGLAFAPAESDTQSYSDDPNQEESEMVSGRFVEKPSRLLFETRKLKRSMRLSGTVKVKLRATVDQVDTNFTALLVDYGKATRVDHEGSGEGVSATGKETCFGKSTPEDDACYGSLRRTIAEEPYEIVSRGWLDARHRKSLRQGELLTPGETYNFRWTIFGEDYFFKKGHRLAIVIAGSDATWTISDPEAAGVEVALAKSFVKLPLVGAKRALRPY